MSNVLEVDLKGLSQLIEDQGPGRLITELVRNSLDEDGVTAVDITLTMEPGRPLCKIIVTDDAPGGFADLSHAYTLFAPSYKKGIAEKAGRFNMGDKLFLAAAVITGQPARIVSTTGGMTFHGNTRSRTNAKTEKGSVVEAYLKMTREQYNLEVLPLLRSLLIPAGVKVTLNDNVLESRVPLHTFTATLQTPLADDEGVLRIRQRQTTIQVFEPGPDEVASLYELGVSVVPTEDRWHINVGQKVPLNMQRDNVPPAYLRTIRTLVVNEMAAKLTKDDVNQTWVREATSDERIDKDVMEKVLDLRFGDKRVIFDPNDPEANKTAVAKGFTVIQGGMLNKNEWNNVRKTETTLPAGKMFPSPKPYSDDPNAPMVKVVPESEWTDGMKKVAAMTRFMHRKLFNGEVHVRIVDTNNNFRAAYARTGPGSGEFDYNLRRLGYKFFDGFTSGNTYDVMWLIAHEFGHQRSGDHLSEEYHDGLCEVAAKLFNQALVNSDAIEEILEGTRQ